MGIRFFCPNGHKLNVKSELAGKIGICPKCQARMEIPTTSVWELARKDEREKPTNDERARGDDGATLDKCDERLGGLDDVAAQGETAQSAQAQWDEEDAPTRKRLLDGERVEAALTDVVRRAVDGAGQSERGAAGVEDSDPLRDPRFRWFVWNVQEWSGPVDGVGMAKWIEERRIGPQTPVIREDWATWQPAGRVFAEELKRVFEGGAPATAENENASGAQMFASLAEAAQNSDAARRFAEDESRAMRRRKRATKTLATIVGLIVLVLGLLGALIFVLLSD